MHAGQQGLRFFRFVGSTIDSLERIRLHVEEFEFSSGGSEFPVTRTERLQTSFEIEIFLPGS